MIQAAIVITVIHLVYYSFFEIFSDIRRIRSRIDVNHHMILKLQDKYKVNIRVFHTTNKNHHGFSMIRSIYLASHLLNSVGKKFISLQWVFHHEHYHLTHEHKLKTLAGRLFLSLTPLSMIWINSGIWLVAYGLIAVGLYYMNEYFENKANEYANEKMYEDYPEIDNTKK